MREAEACTRTGSAGNEDVEIRGALLGALAKVSRKPVKCAHVIAAGFEWRAFLFDETLWLVIISRSVT